MSTSYRVTNSAGQIIGIYAKAEDGSHWADIKALVAANPGAEVKPVVSSSNPCAEHPAFEADNCPSCGTSRMGH